jgi:hypothetical protein
MDGLAELAAGCFSNDYDNTIETGMSLGLPRDRLYRDYRRMIRAEARRPTDRLRGHRHAEPVALPDRPPGARARLPRRLRQAARHLERRRAGPGRAGEEEAAPLRRDLRVLGYPMVRQMREMVAAGELGDIRFVAAEYPQDWLATPTRADRPEAGGVADRPDAGGYLELRRRHRQPHRAHGRLRDRPRDPIASRPARPVRRRGTPSTTTPRSSWNTGGAKGLYWSSQVAVGHDNGFRSGSTGRGRRSSGRRKPELLPGRVRGQADGPAVARPRRAVTRRPSPGCRGSRPAIPRATSSASPTSTPPSSRPSGRRKAGREADRGGTSTSPASTRDARGVRFIEAVRREFDARGAAWVKF